MNQQQREALKILGIAFITGIILTIWLGMIEGEVVTTAFPFGCAAVNLK